VVVGVIGTEICPVTALAQFTIHGRQRDDSKFFLLRCGWQDADKASALALSLRRAPITRHPCIPILWAQL